MIAVGDSHVLGLRSVMEIRYVGPATAHNLGEKKSRTMAGRQLGRIAAGTTGPMLLIFGEIDCRIHLACGDISETVRRYIAAVLPLQGRGLTLRGVAGAAHQSNIYNRPGYANIKTRGGIVLAFNSALRDACQSAGIGFLDMSVFHDSEGILDWAFTTDGVHLDSRALPFYERWLGGHSQSQPA